jgi:hypothetical protein
MERYGVLSSCVWEGATMTSADRDGQEPERPTRDYAAAYERLLEEQGRKVDAVSVDEFLADQDFPDLYKNYRWGEDTYYAGFPRMLKLEAELSYAAKENRLRHEHLVDVEKWGRKRGHSVESPDEVQLSLYVDGDLNPELLEAPEAALIELDRQITYFGPTYLSKVLLFACPEYYGAIDTWIVKVFGRKGNGWFDLYVLEAAEGASIPPTQAGWPSEYGTWIRLLREIAEHLNEEGSKCPHPECYLDYGLRSGGEWFCADVERALFSYAYQNEGEGYCD